MTNVLSHPALRLVVSGAVVFAVLAAVAAASSALLTTNTASADDSVITVSSPNILEIAADNNGQAGPYSTSITSPINESGFLPGETREFTFWLKNISSDDIRIDLMADLANYVYTDTTQPTPSPLTAGQTDLDADMNVSFSCVREDSPSSTLGSAGPKPLTGWTSSSTTGKEDLTGGAVHLRSTSFNSSFDEAKCTMTVALDAENNDGGHSVNFDTLFTGEQFLPSPTPTTSP